MNLHDLYESAKTPEDQRILFPRDIAVIIPSADYDCTRELSAISLTKYEVCLIWPKKGLHIFDEILALSPKMVLQAGCNFFKKFPVITNGLDEKFRRMISRQFADSFVALHHHDEFSMRDGLGNVNQLIDLLKSQRRSYCCVTNHGSVGGWIKQYTACKKAGIKPIFGMEAYTNEYRGDDPEEKKKNRSAHHLLTIAKTEEGFYNLIQIHNDAQINGFYYSPRANREAFRKWGKGIVGTTACCIGEVSKLLMADEWDKAEEVFDFYNGCFDEFYVELPLIEFELQVEVNKKLVELARRVNAKTILTCDSHYLTPEQAETHDILMMIRDGKTINDVLSNPEEVWQFSVRNLFYRNGAQMENLFREGFVTNDGKQMPPYLDNTFTEDVFWESMENTRLIAQGIEDINLDSEPKLPKMYPDSEKIIVGKVREGAKNLGIEGKKEYEDRLKFELKIINDLGWNDYFLIMEKIISDAIRDYGEYAVGYGRGSAAGSLVSYCLGVTYIDPIEHGLLFERFLDYSRSDPPDIDTDFDTRIRGHVKENIVETFGEEKTCSIGSYGTYKTASIIVDVSKALGYDWRSVQQITKEFDATQKFDVQNDEGNTTQMNVDQMEFEELYKYYPKLGNFMAEHPDVDFHSKILRNQVRNMSTHAGGVIISSDDLRGKLPLFKDKNGKIVSTWVEGQATQELSKIGLVKFDILGLTNLDIIADCLKLIKESRGIDIKRKDIPISDKESIKLGSKQDLKGIFQLEASWIKPYVDAVKVETISDLSALTSLIRPGPKDEGMPMIYAKRKNGEKYESIECMRDVLDETYGVITYQEQCMITSQKLAGFSGPESNKLRKAMGKKKKSIMNEMKNKFITGAQKRIDSGEVDAEEVEGVWDLLESFAGYGFNKSHAVAYSAISAVELWLRFNYQVEYLTSLLNNIKNLSQKKFGSSQFIIVEYINYIRSKGIKMLPPCVNGSVSQFSIENGRNIRFSLGAIKNVASSASAVSSNAPYKDIEDFHERAKNDSNRRPNKKVVESLIASGAFNEISIGIDEDGNPIMPKNRNEILVAYYDLRKDAKLRAPKEEGILRIFTAVELKTEKEWDAFEKDVIRMRLSKTPIREQYKDLIKEKRWCLIDKALVRNSALVFGRIEDIISKTSKNGNPMYVIDFCDDINSMTIFVFKNAMRQFNNQFKKGYIIALPIKSFEDSASDMRFYDNYKSNKVEIIEK